VFGSVVIVRGTYSLLQLVASMQYYLGGLKAITPPNAHLEDRTHSISGIAISLFLLLGIAT
jgi:hypothetical protein